MVSYEKIRQSLCSWTLFIAWVNVLAVLAKIFTIISYFTLLNNLDTIKSTYDADTYQTIVAATNERYYHDCCFDCKYCHCLLSVQKFT